MKPPFATATGYQLLFCGAGAAIGCMGGEQGTKAKVYMLGSARQIVLMKWNMFGYFAVVLQHRVFGLHLWTGTCLVNLLLFCRARFLASNLLALLLQDDADRDLLTKYVQNNCGIYICTLYVFIYVYL